MEKVWEEQWKCQSDGWERSSSAHQSLEEKSLNGEFTETGPINNDPEVEASLLVYMSKNMLVFGTEEESHFAFKLINPQQFNDNNN